MVRHFRDLIVWQRSMDMVVQVYQITEPFPSKEMFGLTNQLRRAAVSVPSNIAEGQGRNTSSDFLRYLSISKGSLQEVQTQVEIANRLNISMKQSLAISSTPRKRLLDSSTASVAPSLLTTDHSQTDH